MVRSQVDKDMGDSGLTGQHDSILWYGILTYLPEGLEKGKRRSINPVCAFVSMSV